MRHGDWGLGRDRGRGEGKKGSTDTCEASGRSKGIGGCCLRQQASEGVKKKASKPQQATKASPRFRGRVGAFPPAVKGKTRTGLGYTRWRAEWEKEKRAYGPHAITCPPTRQASTHSHTHRPVGALGPRFPDPIGVRDGVGDGVGEGTTLTDSGESDRRRGKREREKEEIVRIGAAATELTDWWRRGQG